MITFIYEIKIAKNRVIHAHTHRLQRRPATARAADTDTDADTATDTGADTHIPREREANKLCELLLSERSLCSELSTKYSELATRRYLVGARHSLKL